MNKNSLIRKNTLMASLVMLATTMLPAHGHNGDAIAQAISHTDRPAKDRQLDQSRKPDQVLRFFNIKPGMKVLDVFSGPGYYSEILNHLVGPKGNVTMYNHAPWEAYTKKLSDKRVLNGRLKQVNPMYVDINTLKLPAKDYDAAIMVLGMHDLYLDGEKSVSGEALNDGYFFKALFDGLKPGAVLGIVEHLTKPGTPTNADLHRMNASHIRKVMFEAGFVLEAESGLLRNADDAFDKVVFDKAVRRKTDRGVMRFRKPLKS